MYYCRNMVDLHQLNAIIKKFVLKKTGNIGVISRTFNEAVHSNPEWFESLQEPLRDYNYFNILQTHCGFVQNKRNKEIIEKWQGDYPIRYQKLKEIIKHCVQGPLPEGAGTAEAAEDSDDGAAASGKPAASSTEPTTEVTDGAPAREVVSGAATKVTDSGAAAAATARVRRGCVSNIDDDYVVYLKPLTHQGNGFYTIPGEPHKFSLQDHSQQKNKTFYEFDELWTIDDDTKSGAYNLKISNGEFVGLTAFSINDNMRVYRIEQDQSPYQWDKTSEKRIPNSKRITILTDSVTEGELLNLMFVDSNVSESHMVIAPKKFKKSLEYFCKIKLGTFQGYSSETQTISFTRQKETNETWTVRDTAGDGWCGWHAIFVGLHENGVHEYSGINIKPDKNKMKKSIVSLTGDTRGTRGTRGTKGCKKKLQEKIQEQSRELFPEDTSASDAIEEEEEENVQLEMAQDIRTIIYHLRKDSTNPVDLTVNVLDETNLGGIQVFSTPPVFRKGRAITLNIKFNGEVGQNTNHFELCEVTNGPSGSSDTSASSPSDSSASGPSDSSGASASSASSTPSVALRDGELRYHNGLLHANEETKGRIKKYLNIAMRDRGERSGGHTRWNKGQDKHWIWAVYPQPDEHSKLGFNKGPRQTGLYDYSPEWLFGCYLGYFELLRTLDADGIYQSNWKKLFTEIWMGRCRITGADMKRVCGVSKQLKVNDNFDFFITKPDGSPLGQPKIRTPKGLVCGSSKVSPSAAAAAAAREREQREQRLNKRRKTKRVTEELETRFANILF